jgi:hypothetical protein
MAEPSDIARRALTLANSFLEDATKEIVNISDGDLNALFEASQILRQQSVGQISAHSAEHLAFSLITAAHSELRTAE